MPAKMERRFVNASVPYVFKKHGVNSCFLINFWEPLVMLLILILFLVVVLGLDWVIVGKCMKKKNSLQSRIITRVKVMVLNFLIVQLYGMYGDIVFYGVIEFRTTQVKAGINFLSSAAVVILLVAMILGFFLHWNLLKRYQNIKRNFGAETETKQYLDRFLADNEGIQVIFGDFKDQSLIHQSFLFVLTIRDILFSIILATLFEHPLTECILILLMNIAMLLYLIIKRPFKDIVGQIQQLVMELITFVVNVSILILAILDRKQLEAFDERKTLGKLLIIINMVFNFSIVFFMLFSLGRQGFEVYKEYKDRRRKVKAINKSVRGMISLQNVSSIEVAKNNIKNEGNTIEETCQTMIKTRFEENGKAGALNDQSQPSLDSSMMISSYRSQMESSSRIVNPYVIENYKPVKQAKIRKRRIVCEN